MKKTLAWILVLSFILTMLPMSALADGDYWYELEIDSDMKAEVDAVALVSPYKTDGNSEEQSITVSATAKEKTGQVLLGYQVMETYPSGGGSDWQQIWLTSADSRDPQVPTTLKFKLHGYKKDGGTRIVIKLRPTYADAEFKVTLKEATATVNGITKSSPLYINHGDVVEIKANDPASGKVFDGWDVSGDVVGSAFEPSSAMSTSYTFTTPKNPNQKMGEVTIEAKSSEVKLNSSAVHIFTGGGSDADSGISDGASLPTSPTNWFINLKYAGESRSIELKEIQVGSKTYKSSDPKEDQLKAMDYVKITNNDESVVKIHSDGSNPMILTVKPEKVGAAIVKIKIGSTTYQITFGVKDEPAAPAVASIKATPEKIELYVGSKMKATATAYDSSSKEIPDVEFDWSVVSDSDNQYITVDKSGTITVTKYKYVSDHTVKVVAASGGVKSNEIVVTIRGIPADGLKLSDSELTMYRYGSAQLTATVSPSNASWPEVVWTSSDSSIVSVDSTGKLTAHKGGSATITATIEKDSVNVNGPISKTCKVTVKDGILLTDMRISRDTIDLAVDETYTLTLSFEPSNATNTKVTWESSNPTVATVDEKGVVTALKEGAAVIKASSMDGSNLVRQCTVSVTSVAVSAVTLDKANLSMIQDDTAQLTAHVYPTNASNKALSWSSSNKKVAKVDSNGLVTAVGGGSCVITAKAKDGSTKYADCVVTVIAKNPVKAINLNYGNFSMLINDTVQLIATISPSDATYSSVTWKSDNTAVATVSDKGLVTTKAEGQANITVTAGGVSKTIRITATSSEYSTGVVTNCSRRVNVRKKANGSSEQIGYAYLGDTYRILGKSGSWYKIQYNAKTEGYIWSYYIKTIATTASYTSAGKTTSSTTPGGTGSTSTKTLTIINCKSCINVRSTPDSSITTNKIGLAYLGQTFVWHNYSNGWYEITFNDGQTAYISASFVQLN